MIRKLVTLDMETFKRVEDYRFLRRFKTETEALRSLIEIGLTRFEAAEAKTQMEKDGK